MPNTLGAVLGPCQEHIMNKHRPTKPEAPSTSIALAIYATPKSPHQPHLNAGMEHLAPGPEADHLNSEGTPYTP